MVDVKTWECIALDSGDLRAIVLPGRGGDVLSLEHRPSRAALLWNVPWQTPTGPDVPAGADFHEWYLGGMQDLFPNGGAPARVDGIQHEQHGESWRRAWTPTLLPDGVALDVTLDVLPLRASKEIAVDGSTLRLRERLEHVGDKPFRMMWGHHPTYGGSLVEEGCRIDLPGGRTECFGAAVDRTSRLADQGEGRWPFVPGRDGQPVDVSLVPGPERRSHDVCLVTDLEAGWYALRNPRRGLGVAARFPRELFRFLWLWQPYGGATFAPFDQGIYALAIEMWTSPPSLNAAVERNAALPLAPRQAIDAELELTVFTADDRPVVDVAPGGEVSLG